jgi:hypothetical protein
MSTEGNIEWAISNNRNLLNPQLYRLNRKKDPATFLTRSDVLFLME